MRVSYFLANGQWHLPNIKKWVPDDLIDQILRCPISLNPSQEDKVVWAQPSFRSFSIAGAYHAVTLRKQSPDGLAKITWRLKIPAKMKFHLWLLLHKSLPVASLLHHSIPTISAQCVICGSSEEDHLHLFRECPFASATWTKFLPSLMTNQYDSIL